VPVFDAARSGDFKISGLVEEPVAVDRGRGFRACWRQTEVTSDFSWHCVTRWSRLDKPVEGVLFTGCDEAGEDEAGGRSLRWVLAEGKATNGKRAAGRLCFAAGRAVYVRT